MDIRSLRVVAAAVAAACVVAACGDSNPTALLASAKAYMAKADYTAAMIELKNALQRAPDNGEARLLLARLLLESGDPVAAETEARKALDSKYPEDEVLPVLARAMAAQGQYRKVVDQYAGRTLASPQAQADLATTLGIAWQGLGEHDKALASLDAALAAKPDSTSALVAKAGVLLSRRDVAGALKLLDTALAAAPGNVEASVLKADVLVVEGRADEALPVLDAAARAHPNDLASRASLVGKLVSAGDKDRAASVVEEMRKIGPKDIRTVYSDALVSFSRRDAAHARDMIQQVLAVRPEHMQSLYLSGLIHLELKQYSVAEEALRRVLSRAPIEPGATRALVTLYLRTGRPGQALELIEPALKRAPRDAMLLRAAGEAYLQMANAAKAAQFYERANAVDKGNVASEVRLAQLRLATGDASRGMADLEALSQAETSGTQADMALLTAHVRRREFDKALRVASTIEKKQPSGPQGPFVRATVYMAKRDFPNARTGFEKALAAQSDFFPAVYNLAMLDVFEGKVDAARKRYDGLLAKDAKNEQALIANAELLAMSGGTSDQVKAAIQRAVDANPASTRPRVALITYQLRQRDARSALAAAQATQAVPTLRDEPAIIEALAAAQLASGETNAAIDTLRRSVRASPQNPAPLLQLASAYAVAKDYDASIDSARKALAINPELAQSWIGLAKAYVAAGRPDDAIAEARKLRRERPEKAFGYLLEAELLGQQNKWQQAADVMKEGLARDPSSGVAVRYVVALNKAGRDQEASAFGQRWIKDHPKDAAMHMYFAEKLQARKDWRGAAAHYQVVLEHDPDNVLMLNNLAWALGEAGDPKAREVAERAYRQAPFNPNVIDTLGWVALQQGDAARAVQLLRMASNLAAGDPAIRLHYAKALIKTGDRTGARRELDALTASDRAAAIKGEAEKLRGEL
jgi:putative PEP-CTERM system TPR-repeat lipoprotein